MRQLLVRNVLLVRIEVQDAGTGRHGFRCVAAEELASLGFREVKVVGDGAECVVVGCSGLVCGLLCCGGIFGGGGGPGGSGVEGGVD